MGRIEQLAERYGRYIALPWRDDLSGAERAMFVVYDKRDERRVRARRQLFAEATEAADHGWIECDLTSAFAEWMATQEYRESYFESPEDLGLKLDKEFPAHVADLVRAKLEEADGNTVVAVTGIAALFGFARVSDVLQRLEGDVKGRILVFFPGEYEQGNYRLLDARDGWNYLAVPITLHDQPGVYQV